MHGPARTVTLVRARARRAAAHGCPGKISRSRYTKIRCQRAFSDKPLIAAPVEIASFCFIRRTRVPTPRSLTDLPAELSPLHARDRCVSKNPAARPEGSSRRPHRARGYPRVLHVSRRCSRSVCDPEPASYEPPVPPSIGIYRHPPRAFPATARQAHSRPSPAGRRRWDRRSGLDSRSDVDRGSLLAQRSTERKLPHPPASPGDPALRTTAVA